MSTPETEQESHDDPFTGREFLFTQQDFRHIAHIMEQDAGIALGAVKAPLVYSRLVRRLRSLGLESFRQYCALIADKGGAERGQMIAALTTNVTRFFRENHHFVHFRERVLPDLIEKAKRGEKIRFWSAGCSTGEEPYSMALTILSKMPDAPRFDIKILATDINRNVLDVAKAGVYGASDLSSVDSQTREKYFDRIEGSEGVGTWRVSEKLANMVAFRELNLISKWPMRHRYHGIFCRNVAIYFEESIRSAFWNRFASLLAPNGVLYIGHSERVSDARHRFRIEGNTIYRLVPPSLDAGNSQATRPPHHQSGSHGL